MKPISKNSPKDASTPYEQRPLNHLDVRPRKTAFSFNDAIPRHWLAGEPCKTHFYNSINLFAVAFEDFMVRVMHAHLAHVDEPELRRQIRGFMGQEATHARAHEKFLHTLRQQGYHIDEHLRRMDYLFSVVLEKKLGTRMSLSSISGFEHLTALLSEITLADGLLRDAEPPMRSLWEWHAAEELEHKALAFDLLQSVSTSYPLRVAGALLGGATAGACLASGMLLLLRQDGELWRRRTLEDFGALLWSRHRMMPLGLSIFLDYLKPGFHPHQRDTLHLARRVFQPQAPGQQAA